MKFQRKALLQSDIDAQSEPVPCTEDTSCEEGAHSYTWPCDYASGTGRLVEATPKSR